MIVFRVATNRYSILSHLAYNLRSFPESDSVHVIGDDVEGLRASFPHIIFHNIPIMRDVSLYSDIVALIKLVVLFRKIRPDVVHSIMPKAGLLSAIASWTTSVPVRIHTYTGQVWALLPKHSIKRQLLILIDILISKINTECFTDSESQSRFLAENGVTTRGHNCSYFGQGSLNGIDFSRLNISKASSSFLASSAVALADDEKMTCTYIARKSVDKGFFDFINIALKLRQLSDEYRFIFIGPDESNGRLLNIFRENNLPCSWFINIDYVPDFENYILISDLLLLPSHREGFGSIVIEASYMGVPTVGYKIDGLVDSVSDGETGILVKEHDVDAFVKAVELFRTSKELRDRMSSNGRRRAQDGFSANLIFEHYYSYLANAVRRTGTRQ